MPTNKERRNIAQKLRNNADAYPDMYLILNVVLSDDGLKPNDGSTEYVVTSIDAAKRLAELIEPKSEETCCMIYHFDDLFPVESYFECSKCNEEFPDTFEMNYCPNCGAKILEVKQ